MTYTDSKNREWRYPVNLATNECSCRQWQICGKPCIHALHLMTVIGGEDGEVDKYCFDISLLPNLGLLMLKMCLHSWEKTNGT